MLAVAADRPMAKRRSLPLKTLVLNADYQPLSTWPLSLIDAKDAVHALYRGRVTVVEEWADAFYRSPSTAIAVPKVVALREYAPVHGDPKFCRRSILLRDRFSCQYCGHRFPSHELTYDHLIPRSRGGKTTWENIVTACLQCNSRKADRLPNLSGRKGGAGSLRPLKMPRRPTNAELLRAGLEFLPDDVRESFGDWLYWHVELRP
ncbi:MAG TPA: HNH endonuclease [Acetobacteraceae bacterium]|nr:HNH endonuclease [Acetobacteraceae bacterium]